MSKAKKVFERFVLVAVAVALLAGLPAILAGCPIVSLKRLAVSFTGLESLGPDYVYEGWLLVDGAPVTAGRFTVDDEGMLSDDMFLISESNASAATAYILTIEPAVGDDPAPSDTHILGGDVVSGTAALTVDHATALGDDFLLASGEFILNTPSTADDDTDYDHGIWWLDPSAGPGASLVLPVLPAGWVYEGWVVGPAGPLSTGRFVDVSGDDSDLGGPTAGPDGTPPFPGQDYIEPPMVLTGYTAVISVEPDPDNSSAPFLLKPLVDASIEDVGIGVPQSMANNAAATNPTGTVTIAD